MFYAGQLNLTAKNAPSPVSCLLRDGLYSLIYRVFIKSDPDFILFVRLN